MTLGRPCVFAVVIPVCTLRFGNAAVPALPSFPVVDTKIALLTWNVRVTVVELPATSACVADAGYTPSASVGDERVVDHDAPERVPLKLSTGEPQPPLVPEHTATLTVFPSPAALPAAPAYVVETLSMFAAAAGDVIVTAGATLSTVRVIVAVPWLLAQSPWSAVTVYVPSGSDVGPPVAQAALSMVHGPAGNVNTRMLVAPCLISTVNVVLSPCNVPDVP